jgi:phosphoribosyl 1,2-cyclic phosphodiesterase
MNVERFCPLASGSKGNCYFLQTKEATFLIDAGISMKELQKRLALIGSSLSDIDAVIITHEHHDHIAGIKTLTSNYKIPVIANYLTAEAIVEAIDTCPQFKIFTTGEPFSFKNIEIDTFSVQHDGVEPIALTLHTGSHKIGICTDLGFVTKTVIHKLKGCHVLLIEANHYPEAVLASPRPDSYKKRVLGRLGHLSNTACAELLSEVAHSDLSQVYLAHLSSECNCPKKALACMHDFLKPRGIPLTIDIAPQEMGAKVSLLHHT